MNASGITNINSTSADVDSSSSSTIPTAYKTGRHIQRLNQVSRSQNRITSEDEMGPCQDLTLEHFGSDGFPDNAETQGDDKEHEKRQRVSPGVHNCNY